MVLQRRGYGQCVGQAQDVLSVHHLTEDPDRFSFCALRDFLPRTRCAKDAENICVWILLRTETALPWGLLVQGHSEPTL